MRTITFEPDNRSDSSLFDPARAELPLHPKLLELTPRVGALEQHLVECQPPEDPAEHAEVRRDTALRSPIRNCSVVSFVGRIAGRATPGPAYNATERAGEPDRSRRRSGSVPADGLSGCQAIHPHDVRDALFNEQVWTS